MRILLIEDEAALAGPLVEHLAADRHLVEWFDTIVDAESAERASPFDVILLDLQLPDGDGLSFLKSLRDRRVHTPVLILSARDKVSDRIKGLNLGADDYVIKPFDLDEVKARIHTICRRGEETLAQVVVLGDLSINLAEHSVRRADVPLRLTTREWQILETLVRRRAAVVPRESLEAALYAFGEEVESNALEAHISRLRAKLGKDVIVTHRGLGYALCP
ncbi:response regulator transcription factor [Sulfitobacter sp. G21635-S1]|jgi:two-component system OmpR family response regulator|uniref:response regulator transcription factor n=1 Tax=Sulfitobacter sp. G21635-S1 TaxID=3014043 RepID=UPI0022AEA83A|nr:response regulator transcription factor [Sulfitobacter sp. G21635-S1]MCZ4257608.1 response regulator transcription factor [Sulfitobacter sp. G21635-S1]